MPSYAQEFDYRCAGCGHRGRHEIWLAVDIRERPDLARLIASGAATTPRCAGCRNRVVVDGYPSLLIRRPGLRPPLIFATAVDVPQDRMIQQFQMALMLLRRNEPPESQHQQDVQILPYRLLPSAVDRDLEADADALVAGTFQAFTADMQHYRAWLADLVDQRRGRQLIAALTALLQASDTATRREVVLAHPVLLTDEADRMLQHTIEQAAQDAGPEMAAQARHCLVLLRKCREFGTDRVLPPEPPAAAPAQQPTGRALPPAVGTALLMMAGRDPLDEGRPVSPDARRDLLIEALLAFRDEDDDLAVEWRAGNLVPVRDLLTFGLANELIARPASRLDVAEAIRRYAELDRHRQTAPDLWADAQHNTALGHTLLADSRDLAELDAARAAFERALTVRTRTADPDGWATTVAALAALLFRDYPGTDPRPVDEAVAMLAAAVADPPDGIGARPLLNLRTSHATALLQRSHRGDDAALTTAFTELERLRAEVADLDDPELQTVVETNFGHALTHVAERTGRPQDRRRLLDLARSARGHAAAHGDDRLWVQTSGNLGRELAHGREWAEADAVLREAIDRAGRTGMGREWANLHGHLARVLLERTDGDHDEHVAEAVDLLNRARRDVDRTADPENWAWLAGMLAQAYRDIAGHRDTEIELLRAAIAAVPRQVHPMRWAQRVRALAGLLPPAEALVRFAEATEVLTRETHPHEWAAVQHNASLAHRELAVETGDTTHLVRAIACMRDALAIRPPDQAPIEWAQTTRLLAETLHRHDGGAVAVAEAEQLLTRALPLLRDGGRAQDVLWTAQELGEVLVTRGRWAEAVAPLREALEVRDRMYDSGLLRQSREQALARAAGLPVRTAYVLVRAGDPAAAVEALEAGRVRLLGDAMDRDPTAPAAAGVRAPEAYAAYREAARELAAAEAAAARLADRAGTGGSDDVFLRDAEQAVRVELRRTTTAFRTARAALPQTGGVRPERPGHATVYVMAAEDESVLLSTGPDGVRSVRCPGFDEAMLRRYVHGSGLTAGRFDALDECLAVLGRHVVGPLAELLRTAGATRVTLIPVGLFCALPLHAAPYRDGRCLIDDFAVGYAPSRTVRDAVHRIAEQRTGHARHGVAVVDPGSGLPAADYEARMMLEHTGVGPPVTGSAAEVLDALTDATHVHFACHGVSLVDRPLQSHLVLGGGARLALVDLLAADPARRPHRLRLVVASACQTATVETARNPDEFVGLPAGFLTAGVPCFVGTLWPAGDLPSALLNTRFYELLFDDGKPADEALGGAQRWLRDLTGAQLLDYLDGRPALAPVAETQRRFAARFPQRRFYARPEVWSPHVLIGVPIQEGPPQ